MYCKRCGKEISDNSSTCIYCGTPTSVNFTDNPTSDARSVNYYRPQDGPYIHEDNSPLTMGNYLVMFLLLCIPIANLIMLCIWSFSMDANVNKRNFARAYFVFMIISIILVLLLWGSMMGMILALSEL